MSSQTPNINLTLPTGAENVSRQIINDNNTKIDNAVGTLNGKLTPEWHSTGSIQYSRCSGIASINISGSVTPDSNGKIGNVPAGYRPNLSTFFFITTSGDATTSYLAYIKADGDVILYTRGNTIGYAYGSCSYCIYS